MKQFLLFVCMAVILGIMISPILFPVFFMAFFPYLLMSSIIWLILIFCGVIEEDVY